MAKKANSLEFSLESRIERIPFSECWWFIGHQMKGGYSHAHYGNKRELAHRAAYRLWKGDPGDLLVCHACDNPCCVNPAHLFLGTHKDNSQDRDKKGRGGGKKIKGEKHPFCKYSDQQVAEIKSCYANGEKQESIAQRYGMHQSGISRILRKR